MSTHLFLKPSWLSFALALMAISCNNKPIERYTGTVSGCGGFQQFSKQAANADKITIDSTSYCEAERLWWQYESTRECLKFLHARIVANCAAKLSISAEKDGDTISLDETDAETYTNGKALCACCFDTYLDVPNVTPGAVYVNISSKTFLIHTSAKQGVFVLDSTLDSICINK